MDRSLSRLLVALFLGCGLVAVWEKAQAEAPGELLLPLASGLLGA